MSSLPRLRAIDQKIQWRQSRLDRVRGSDMGGWSTENGSADAIINIPPPGSLSTSTNVGGVIRMA
ncbi:MAG TPA: hypothetical protein VKZ79_08950 [Alphaproteobacteria bacterium]|nr:hypothetical protein [Alphaproteobacteria bacterium]